MTGRVAVLVALASLAMLAGCGGPATFVSADPPVTTQAEAWFVSPVAAVQSALRQAMKQEGLETVPAPKDADVLGVKRQIPYVDEESGAPADGPLPVYRVAAFLRRNGKTHVRLVLTPECRACDGSTPYEWEYPGDVLRGVLERTRGILSEQGARFVYPERFRPVVWRRPHR